MILDDAEWAVLDAVETWPLQAGGTFDEVALVGAAAKRTSFEETRLAAAVATLREKGLLVSVGAGRSQVAGHARALLAERAAGR